MSSAHRVLDIEQCQDDARKLSQSLSVLQVTDRQLDFATWLSPGV